MDLLWRDVEEAKARNAFRQALHRLRAAIGDDVLPQDRERLRLIPRQSLSIDLERFESAVNAGRLSEAIDVSVGDFLENATLGEHPFDMWVEQERTRLRTRVARVLTDATSQASAEGRWAEAVAWTRRLMSVAPFEASSAQLAATTLVAAGRRHEARDLLKRFAATMESELGLPLPTELRTLLARLDRQGGPSDAMAARSTLHQPVALPFVGREGELSQLVSLCRATAEESGGFALVKGDSGIGKSRLLAELTSHVKSLGRVTVLNGREHVAGIQLPYAVFAEALRPLVRMPGVVGASRHLLAEAARLLPELRDEIDLPAVTDVEDEAGRLRFFEGIAALIDAAAFERPVVLVVDDVHLAGPSTLELLSYLCARLSRSAVTFIFALRPSDAPASMLARLESIARADSQTHPGRSLSLDLDGIGASASHDAISLTLKGLGVDASLIEQLVSQSLGVPARIADLVRRVRRGERVESAKVSVREILVDRIARLTSVQRRLLFVIALIGRPSTGAVAGAAAHIPDAAVGDALDALVAEALIKIDDQGIIEIDEEALRTALDLAGQSTRAFLSGWIADELSVRSAPPADLARLYATAGQARSAFEQSRLAAFAALAVGALPEATHHLQVARTFAQSHADQEAIESLLSAVGAGRKQIVTPPAPAPQVEARRSAAPSPMAPNRLESLFPNWRVLLGAAIATLAITALVLADRASPSVSSVNQLTGDTLFVAEDAAKRVLRAVTGDVSGGFVVSQRRAADPSVPAWIDSLPRPWANPITDPRGHHVAVERVTATGSDVFLVSADRRDTTPLLENVGDARALGWSPDGRWLLASLAPPGGSFDAGLFAFSGFGGVIRRRVLDTTARRSITEASWSPDGTHIAWVARVGADRQLEVFVSNADGSGAHNVSRHPADDHHIAWSPDGELLAFTSMRDGNAELYALAFSEPRLWRLTFDPAQDDAGVFSNDGDMIAFESTRGGSAGVYVMSALGGEARKVSTGGVTSVLGWRSGSRRYVDRVRIEQRGFVNPGDTTVLRLIALDQFGGPAQARSVEWVVIDSVAARPARAQSGGAEFKLVASRPGLAMVAVSSGRWRYDTALVRIGNAAIELLEGVDIRAWRPLGVPLPIQQPNAILLRADREWESGILSRTALPLVPGLTLATTLNLPVAMAKDAATTVSLALVAIEDSSAVDATAPQFLRYASFSWNAEAGRLIYAVGQEIHTEPIGDSLPASLPVMLRIEPDSTVTFAIAGRERWRSALRVISARQESRAQLWISGRATNDRARLTHLRITLGETPGDTLRR